MGCCDSSTQLGRVGGIFRAGAGVAESNASARLGAAGENPAVARDTIDICDNRNMDSSATRQGSAARWLLLLFVRFYQIFFSPFLGGACKFYPSCSRYAQEAIAMHGARRGAWLAIKRLGRCRPFTKGGFDPLPEPDAVNGAGCGAHISDAFEYNDAEWLRTASKERAQ
jgi:putative membrane protein insertion efficiency factor